MSYYISKIKCRGNFFILNFYYGFFPLHSIQIALVNNWKILLGIFFFIFFIFFPYNNFSHHPTQKRGPVQVTFPVYKTFIIQGKEGRSLDAATLNQMASIVDQAIQAYEKFN